MSRNLNIKRKGKAIHGGKKNFLDQIMGKKILCGIFARKIQDQGKIKTRIIGGPRGIPKRGKGKIAFSQGPPPWFICPGVFFSQRSKMFQPIGPLEKNGRVSLMESLPQ